MILTLLFYRLIYYNSFFLFLCRIRWLFALCFEGCYGLVFCVNCGGEFVERLNDKHSDQWRIQGLSNHREAPDEMWSNFSQAAFAISRCRSRIWSRGGGQVLRPIVADIAKQAIYGFVACPGSFWVFNAQKCILPHSRDSFSLIFDIYFNTKS